EYSLNEMILVVIDAGGETMGLLVDDLDEIVELDLKKIRHLEPGNSFPDGIVAGVINRDGMDYYLIDLQRLSQSQYEAPVIRDTEAQV
ncbi:MAG TPA: hypothetical protein ENN67_04835, partial [Firmicutes bacterium]|nr:hypothetical protein [Bacillota bacterium]